MARHGIFQPSQPGRVGAAFREQPITLSHRIVMRRHFPRMARFQSPNQTVQKAPPATRPFLKQPVHLRRDPNGGHAFGQHRLAAQSLPIQAIDAPFRGPFRVRTGANLHWASARFKPPSRRPGQARAGFLPQVGISGSYGTLLRITEPETPVGTIRSRVARARDDLLAAAQRDGRTG